MAGYIGSKSSVTQVDGYSEAEADAEFVNDPNGAITVSGSNVGIGTSSPSKNIHIKTSTAGSITSGANRQGSVIRLEHDGNYEAGYSGGDFLGGLEFYSGDSSGGEGVRTAIKATIDNPYNTHSLSFYTAPSNSLPIVERMRIDSSGAVTKPYQPAFLAQGNGQTDFPISTATTIDFENEWFDQGADFSSNTFTAPVTGRYLFACMVYTRNLDIGTNYYQLQLITSNRTISAGLGTSGYDADMLYFPFSISLLLDMDVNDTAVLKMDVGSGGANQLIVESQTYFSGYLVA